MTRRLLALAAVALASVPALGMAADQVGDFSLLDQDGYFHQISYYDDHKAIALLVQSNDDKSIAGSIEAFKQARSKYQDQIEFFMINPFAATQSRASVKAQLARYHTDIPVLMDKAQLVSEGLGITKVGEVLLIDQHSTKPLYRGAASNLGQAIEDVLAGRPVKTASAKLSGTTISYPAKVAHTKNGLSYSKDVAPILAENCARCHRDGGIAPFAMNSYAIIKGFAPMIREVLLTKRMPPGQIDPDVGHFKKTYALTEAEAQKVVHWIEAGAEKDGQVDPLTLLTWPKTKWDPKLGEPDLVVKVPPQKIPATGVLDYIRVVVPIEGLDRPRWVKASQYVAGDRTVLHHTLNDLITPGENKKGGFLGGRDFNAARITAYIPGAEPQIEPPNTGGLLKPGSSLALQLHYTTNGKETTDASEIGLWFYKDGEVPQERMSGACACIFTRGWVNIPPFAADHEMKQEVVVPKDAYLYGMLPHMHFRGKRMRFYAEYPDGKVEEILNIAHYNYNWQLDYQLTEPKLLPAGTKMRVVAAFDNSKQNKANPDPSRSVPWGQQSWDEMMFGSITYKFVDQSAAKVADQATEPQATVVSTN